MKKTAIELRTLVMDNSLTVGRISQDDLGTADYRELTALYRNALDALTEWASKDYAHTSTTNDCNAAFTAIKPILELYATDEERIIIDQASMRTMRDLATKPKRQYSKAYKDARSALNKAKKTFAERYADLITLGAPERGEEEETAAYVARVREAGTKTVVGVTDMLEMYTAAESVLTIKTAAEEAVKAAGNWTWKRPEAVNINEFADLVENYIADCLIDGYNIKTSKAIREEKAAARAAKKAEAANK